MYGSHSSTTVSSIESLHDSGVSGIHWSWLIIWFNRCVYFYEFLSISREFCHRLFEFSPFTRMVIIVNWYEFLCVTGRGGIIVRISNEFSGKVFNFVMNFIIYWRITITRNFWIYWLIFNTGLIGRFRCDRRQNTSGIIWECWVWRRCIFSIRFCCFPVMLSFIMPECSCIRECIFLAYFTFERELFVLFSGCLHLSLFSKARVCSDMEKLRKGNSTFFAPIHYLVNRD